MNRFLALTLPLLALAATPLQAAERRYSVISFDRIRVEAPFDIVLAVGKSPSAKAEGTVAALDTVDIRVEGRTLIVRQRSGANGAGRNAPVRVNLATPTLRTATLLGSGRLAIDRMSGLSLNLALAGPGQIKVGTLAADRLDLLAAGSGSVVLGGSIKNGRMASEGTSVLDASALSADELVLIATGNSEVRAAPRRTVNVTASGGATITLANPVACTQRVTGAATVTGCRQSKASADSRP